MDKKFKVAILVGHNSSQQGAFSKELNMTEWQYNKEVANYLHEKDGEMYDVYFRQPHQSYRKQMQDVLDVINRKYYDLVVELHFNSHSDAQAQGSTGLHYKANSKVVEYLHLFQDMLKRIWGVVKRPLIPITKEDLNRVNGAYGILKSKADYVLLEPFFGSNQEEARKFRSYLQYADTLDKSIKKYLESVEDGRSKE